MSTIYQITVSDIRGQPQRHLPTTLSTRYKSVDRAFKRARSLHAENRSVVIIELEGNTMIATWEMEAGSNTVIFNG